MSFYLNPIPGKPYEDYYMVGPPDSDQHGSVRLQQPQIKTSKLFNTGLRHWIKTILALASKDY